MESNKNLFKGRNIIYVTTIFISILLICVSFIPYGWTQAGTILVSVGCSGICAGVMAIFIELQDKKRMRGLQRLFLLPVIEELEHLFGRTLWLDAVFDKIDFNREVDYYLSPDFAEYADSLHELRWISLSECEERLNCLSQKKELSLRTDLATFSKMEKMYQIIGAMSTSLQSEIDNLKKGKLFLVAGEIFSPYEFDTIRVYLDGMIETLKSDDVNHTLVIHTLFQGYKRICTMGNYNQYVQSNLLICWHRDGLPQLYYKL